MYIYGTKQDVIDSMRKHIANQVAKLDKAIAAEPKRSHEHIRLVGERAAYLSMQYMLDPQNIRIMEEEGE
jgi:hypothetical protein